MAEAGEVEKHKVFLDDTFIIKQEIEDDSYSDHKMFIDETALCAKDGELKDIIRIVSTEELQLSTLYIKTESLPEAQNSKIESVKEEGEVNVLDDIKFEIDTFNGMLFCEHCHAYYGDYCTTCRMLVHILNRNVLSTANEKWHDQIPQDILEIRDSIGQLGIFALKVIPEGVKFGPFNGFDVFKCPWKIKGGRLILDKDKSKCLNWMQYINPARRISEGNLVAFQCGNHLYYRSSCQIQKGEELLVYFGEEYNDSLINDIEMDFVPTKEDYGDDVFTCTFCCLGFSSRDYLSRHKSACLHKPSEEFLILELMQCPCCKIYLHEKEYSAHHMVYCCERNVRKCDPSDVTDQANEETDKRKPRRRGQALLEVPLQCPMCKFSTNHKYYFNRHVKTNHSGKKHYECASCEYRTFHKQLLVNHTNAKHLKTFPYKCETCDYKANQKAHLVKHIRSCRLVYNGRFKCPLCEFRTNDKEHLEKHEQINLCEKSCYECPSCEYKANYKQYLKKHIKTKHLKQFDYKCNMCEYKTNEKQRLERHTKAKHPQNFDYKCTSCEYRTNQKQRLENHIKTKHLEEFDYKCDGCDYRTNRKYRLENHIKTQHLEKFDHKCDRCEYKTNRKECLDRHMKTQHLKEFAYVCDVCPFKTCYKDYLKSHIRTKHHNEFSLNCASCEYRTNYKQLLEKHVKAKH